MIEWNDSYSTGNAMVDQDHKQLFASLNELDAALKLGAGSKKIGEIIVFLSTYTREHFAREEKHMQLVGCPVLGENCKAHAALVAKLDSWSTGLKAGYTSALALEVYHETSNWIRGHILKVDCKLRGCRAA
jgi:hemerythrin